MARESRPVRLAWAGTLADADYVQGPTPPARLEYLVALADRVTAALTCHAAPGVAARLNGREMGYPVPPGCKALQPRAIVAWDAAGKTGSGTTTAPAPVTITAASSGATAADVVEVPTSDTASGVLAWPPVGPWALVVGAEVWEPSPTAAMDRLLELTPTLDECALEVVTVDECVGVCLRPIWVGDLLEV